ncbi:hypothetical protein N7522_000522 [Penicillium canescens]|nr:hypothetical protein N7522_000522 [Penicillium canescens]
MDSETFRSPDDIFEHSWVVAMKPPNLDTWMPTEADYMYAPITISSSSTYESCHSPNRAPVSSLPSSLAQASCSRKSPAAKSTPHRLLTDEYRQRICLYHEQNNAATHAEIGALFGVERSTVTKILRRKGIYLAISNRGPSPENRTKRRVPDLKTALSNLVKEYRRSKTPINDEILMNKARAFYDACSLTEGSGVLDKDWLEIFKRENKMLFAQDQPCTKTGEAMRIQQQCINWNIAIKNMDDVSPISVREPPSAEQARHAMKLVMDYCETTGQVSPQERVSISIVMERLENDHRLFGLRNNWHAQPLGEVSHGVDGTLPTTLF